MYTKVIKRDGAKREFNLGKIKTAIEKANADVHEMSQDDIEHVVLEVKAECDKADEEIAVQEKLWQESRNSFA